MIVSINVKKSTCAEIKQLEKNNGNVQQIHGEDKIVVPSTRLEPATNGDITRQ